MKKCLKCGMLNDDGSVFCAQCGGQELEDVQDVTVQMNKHEFTKFDLCTIFGFVASLVGLFQLTLILEPLALLATFLGFFKGKCSKGLAVAGITISIIGLLIRLFVTLYTNHLIPQWLIAGILG